ncbi:MAG: hypothetical protein WD096_02740 [Actinomycetota bacterium]
MDDLTRRALLRALGAFVAVLAIGSAGVLSVGVLRSGGAGVSTVSPTPSGSAGPTPDPRSETWLTWIPGGLPEQFGPQLTTVPAVGDVTVATADIAWMTGSVDAAGVPVDQPLEPYMIPIDTTGFEPAFASFIPQPERRLVSDLQPAEGILSETAANLRGLGEGATLTFDTGQILTIAGTLPDHLMGGYELLVTRTTGETIGVTHERYVLFHLKPNASANPERMASLFLPYIPADHPFDVAQVRAPGDTRYLRANDRELPPADLKVRFGEFTAYPDPATPGALVIDPVWIDDRIATATVPVLGEITCHEKVIRYLTNVMQQLEADQKTDLITDVGACYEPIASPDDPSGPFTGRAFGTVIDLNEALNEAGETPEQEFALRRFMYRGGFGWGGRDAYPQGSRFRYDHRPERVS